MAATNLQECSGFPLHCAPASTTSSTQSYVASLAFTVAALCGTLDLLMAWLVLNVDSNLNCLHLLTSLFGRFGATTVLRFVF